MKTSNYYGGSRREEALTDSGARGPRFIKPDLAVCPMSCRARRLWSVRLGNYLGFGVWSLGFLVALSLGTASALAQNYTITSSVIGAGGGTSTNAQFTLSGTIGQAAAGATMSGGSYTVDGGFWQAITLVQTPGAPLLQLTRNGAQATIFWDSAVTGFILEFTASLKAPANWQPASGVANNSVTIPTTTGALFFRLRQSH